MILRKGRIEWLFVQFVGVKYENGGEK